MNEQEIAEHWEKNHVREKAIAKEGKPYYFLDGPPYATSNIHMGTALNKVLKDYYIRFKRMRGHWVWCQPGYDCHGLPIENMVERKLGLKNKDDIEKYGVGKFIEECKKYATQYIGVMSCEFANLGIWMDWERPYLTLNKEFMEGAWHTFKKANEKGLLYKGIYPVHVCPHCQTAVAYNEIEYETREDTSVYVKFRLTGKDEFLAIWTTTPWTLPSNTGVMVNPKYEYSLVETLGGKMWMATELVSSVMEKLEAGYKLLKTIKGKDMEGWRYDPALPDLPLQNGVDRRVIMSERYVNLEGGTGLVHTAPGHGLEDYIEGTRAGLAQLSPLGLDGRFDSTAGKYTGVYAKDADAIIINDLRSQGALLKEEKFSHEYPMCWRCHSPLLFMSVPQWFFKITGFKAELRKQSSERNWIPEWAGKRFDNWLDSLGDWPISRQRYWGIPLPIWQCESCGKTKVFGSTKELGVDMDDIHKPFIDDVVVGCECGAKMRRVPDILDVWFDSGCAPWASLGYPAREDLFDKLWPVDFVLEGPDQTRGWWNSTAICGYITFDRIPWDNIMQHGLVLVEKGVKMSKSRGNVVSPQQIMEKYSRDTLRYYLLRYDPSIDMEFTWDKVDDAKKFFTVLSNSFNFFKLYCKPAPLANLKPEDEWVISRVNSLAKSVGELNDSFQGFKALQLIEEFVMSDLSRWYIKLVRDRTWPTYNGADKQAAFATLYYVLHRLNRMLAPAVPYMTESNNLEMFGEESVHLLGFPEAERINAPLEEQMLVARRIVEACAFARNKAGVKLRWPLSAMVVKTKDEQVRRAVETFNSLLQASCNVKQVWVNRDIHGEALDFEGGSLVLNTTMDTSLKKEALAAELTRTVQDARKKAKLEVGDRIKLFVNSSDPGLNEWLAGMGKEVSPKLNAVKYSLGSGGEWKAEFEFFGHKVAVSFAKA